MLSSPKRWPHWVHCESIFSSFLLICFLTSQYCTDYRIKQQTRSVFIIKLIIIHKELLTILYTTSNAKAAPFVGTRLRLFCGYSLCSGSNGFCVFIIVIKIECMYCIFILKRDVKQYYLIGPHPVKCFNVKQQQQNHSMIQH